MNILLIVLVIIVLWSVWGYFSSRVEQPAYTVLETKSEYEIREYPAHIVAETTVTGQYRDALSQGFRIIAGYIFGGNVSKKSIAMTAPVVAKNVSEKIAMTAPVVASTNDAGLVVSFGMPRSYTLETLPTPNDSRIRLREVPAQKLAVFKFTWMRTPERIRAMQEKLGSSLMHDGVTIVGDAEYAGYNAPWTPPWMQHHEVMFAIQ